MPDEHQITPLNALWKIDRAAPGGGVSARLFVAAVIARVVKPLFEQQQAFNAAIVDHINRNVAVDQRETRDPRSTSTLDRCCAIAARRSWNSLPEPARRDSCCQQITPYVDTRDRDVAGLLRGLSGAINAVADEMMKRSEALLARDATREQHARAATERVDAVQQRLGALEASIADLRRHLDRPVDPRDAS